MDWFLFVNTFFQTIKKLLHLNSVLKISYLWPVSRITIFFRGTNTQIIGVNSFQVNILQYIWTKQPWILLIMPLVLQLSISKFSQKVTQIFYLQWERHLEENKWNFKKYRALKRQSHHFQLPIKFFLNSASLADHLWFCKHRSNDTMVSNFSSSQK